MSFVRQMAEQWAGAAKARAKLGLTRALLHVLATCCFLLALGFGVAGLIVALAAEVGTVWALGLACVTLLAVSATIAFFARPKTATTAPPLTSAALAPPELASEVAFLLGFVAIRALMRSAEKSDLQKK